MPFSPGGAYAARQLFSLSLARAMQYALHGFFYFRMGKLIGPDELINKNMAKKLQ
ncbi:hypothetical protein [Janthinobacterium sp. FW305-128]|uniref:hypothetical protein n=1 Tax=Janthinobacterium sp. FW305-128 TaxID=2775055 RepID=UPI001E299355|nr:hypothetical protein [Janthinobacterium sp. FW305-128]MCC7683231.1 hypothetical protein [Janthinobacterium sp. FW305-128]